MHHEIWIEKMNIKKYGMAGKIDKKVLTWLLLLSPVLYVVTCSYISGNKSAAFEFIKVGDTKDAVIDRLGKPSHIEQPGILFSRYATHQCSAPCAERLWFENKLILSIEAWSVEVDKNNQVINKSYWVSP